MRANRVGGRIDLRAPTPSDMRVHILRFLMPAASVLIEPSLGLDRLASRRDGAGGKVSRHSPPCPMGCRFLKSGLQSPCRGAALRSSAAH